MPTLLPLWTHLGQDLVFSVDKHQSCTKNNVECFCLQIKNVKSRSARFVYSTREYLVLLYDYLNVCADINTNNDPNPNSGAVIPDPITGVDIVFDGSVTDQVIVTNWGDFVYILMNRKEFTLLRDTIDNFLNGPKTTDTLSGANKRRDDNLRSVFG